MLLPPGKFVGLGLVEYNTECPFTDCTSDRFYWNIEKEVGFCQKCTRSVVGVRKFNRLFEAQLQEISRRIDRGDAKFSVPHLIPAWEHDKSCQYLKSRDITVEESLQYRICYSENSNEIYIPVYSLTPGYRANWMRRKVYHKSGGWKAVLGMEKNFYAFGHMDIYKSATSVVIVEGIFDVLTPKLQGYAIALLGINMSGTQLCYLVDHFDKFYLWLDPGGPARKAVKKITEQLEMYGKKVINLETESDPGEHGWRHPFVKGMKKMIDEER